MSKHPLQQCVKRLIDVVTAAAILVVCAPLLGVVALLIRWKMGRPVLFRQQRPGLHTRPFLLYKFRTMTDAHRLDGSAKSNTERITPLGRFLRRTSLDELPQLWNVLRGDLSVTGPRPLLMEYLGRYTAEQARRHDVRPGLTGWAQINGRNAISWEEKFALDVWYIDHWSLWLDLQIFLTTMWRVLRCEGVNADENTTMPIFLGTMASDSDLETPIDGRILPLTGRDAGTRPCSLPLRVCGTPGLGFADAADRGHLDRGVL